MKSKKKKKQKKKKKKKNGKKEKKTCTQRLYAQPRSAHTHTPKAAIYQISRHLISSFSGSANMEKMLKYLPTQASIGSDVSLKCGAVNA